MMKNPKAFLKMNAFLLFSLFLSGLLFQSTKTFAQRQEDVVYLSNGTIIHGLLLKDISDSTVRILNHAGDTWVFSTKDVDSVTREKPFEYKAKLFNQPGFEFNINAEFLMRSGSNAIGKAAVPGIMLGMAYRFNPYISAGAETGVEFYDLMELPVSVSLRVRSSGRVLSPFAFMEAGYTLPAEKRVDDWDYKYKSKGGINSTVGVGLEKILNENASFLFSFSYHYQELNYHLTPLHQWVRERNRTEAYSRFRLSLGYVFK